MNIRLRYFAQLRDASGKDEEFLSVEPGDITSPGEWYERLSRQYGFPLPRELVRPAVNGRYVAWGHALGDGDELAFIPPVAGG